MKVKELIKALKGLDQEAFIVVPWETIDGTRDINSVCNIDPIQLEHIDPKGVAGGDIQIAHHDRKGKYIVRKGNKLVTGYIIH